MAEAASPGMVVAVALGVVGGAACGKYAAQHLFVQGLTKEERKGMLLLAASTLGYYAMMKLVNFGKYQAYADALAP